MSHYNIAQKISNTCVAATDYIQKKIPVIPLVSGKKIPATPHGLKDCSTDPNQISDWFATKPYNIGLVTGSISGIVIIDDDCYAEGGSGLAALEAHVGKLPETKTVRTRAGGYQYYFKSPQGTAIKCSTSKIAKNVDIRGDGGYVVAPPSYVEADSKGKAGYYETIKDVPLAELPKAWIELLADKKKASTPPQVEACATTQSLLGGFVLPTTIHEGQRNSILLSYAGHLRGRGVPEDVILQIVKDTNQSKCRPPLMEDEVNGIVSRYSIEAEKDDGDWPDPQPIAVALPQVPTFDLELLPDQFRALVEDVAEQMQAPADYVAIPLMVGAAAALGNSITIAPKRNDIGWQVTPTIWGAIVGRPGQMKSPSIDAAFRSLSVLESDLATQFEERWREYELARLKFDAAKTRFEKNVKAGAQVTANDMPVEPISPKQERILVNDSTVPKIGEILKDSPRGILLFRDELTGLLETLSADGHEGDRAFYLEAWNGNKQYRIDRIVRGSFVIPKLNVLLFGGIQPGKLQSYIRQATQGGTGDDGLLQRIQLIVWPDNTKDWVNIDRLPNLEAQLQVEEVFRHLRNIDPVRIGAIYPPTGNGTPYLHFTSEAQDVFDQWRSKLELALRRQEWHPALESHYAKYRSLIPALALLIHLVDEGTGPVTKAALVRAIKWGNYLRGHAKRVYASVTDSASICTKALADKIRAGKVQDGFTARSVYRKCWANLSSPEETSIAVDGLIEAGWLRAQYAENGGRKGLAYQINPKVVG